MRTTSRRLDSVFPEALMGQGIFYYLDNFDVPWKQAADHMSLDMEYHGNHSGDKIISPVVRKLCGDSDPIPETVYQSLASILWTHYGISWTKLYQTLSLEYNPINNYDMTENEETTREGESSTSTSQTRTDNLSKKREADNSDTESGTVGIEGSTSNTKTLDLTKKSVAADKDAQSGKVGVSTSDTGTVGVEGSNSSDNSNSINGFNSVVAVPSDSSTTSGTTSSTTTNNLAGTKDTEFSIDVDKTVDETVTDTGTDSDSGTQKRDETRDLTFGHKVSETITDTGTVTQEGSGSDKSSGNETRKLTRSGNIGVTTSQQMIQSERELWLWNFFDKVFSDIDLVLTLPIY